MNKWLRDVSDWDDLKEFLRLFENDISGLNAALETKNLNQSSAYLCFLRMPVGTLEM